MDQRALFHESVYEATSAVVQALGGPKKVGPMLWPEKTIDAAAQLLRDCLNPTRKERLDQEQELLLMKLGRSSNCHDLMYFKCAEAGYARPLPIEPEDELTSLLRQYMEIKKVVGVIEPKIEARIAQLRSA